MNPRDLVAVAAAGAAWWGSWSGTSGTWTWWLVIVVGAAACGLAPLLAHRFTATSTRTTQPVWIVVAAASALALLGGCGVGAARSVAISRGPLVAAADARSSGLAEAIVIGDPRSLRDGRSAAGPTGRCVVQVRVERFAVPGREFAVRTPAVIFGTQPWCDLALGSRVRAIVTWGPSQDAAVAALGSVRAAPDVVTGPALIQRNADRVREALREASRATPFTGGALVPALVVGDESLMTEPVVDDLRGAGLAHLSAVSGANVAIVLGVVLLLARRLGLRTKALTAAGVLVLVAFVVLARPEPSVLRAAVMGGVALLAAWRGGPVRPVAAISTAVLLLVLIDPWLARSPGFALSVAATAGLVVLLRRWHRPGSGRVRTILLATVAAQLAVAPVIAGLGGRLDVGGVLANVLAEPAVAPATVLGLLAAVVALLHPAAGQAVALVAAIPAQWIVLVAHGVASRRWAWLPWPSGWRAGLLLAVLLMAGAVGRWILRTSRARASLRLPPRSPWASASMRGGPLVALAVVALTVVGLPVSAKAAWPARDWRLVMCDVGQGDALVLATRPHRGIVIDVGPDARHIDRCLRDLGVTQIDLLVLTHFHADHINGLRGAVRGRSVTQALVSPLDEPVAGAREVRDVLGRERIPIAIAEPGSGADIGPWHLEVLAPISLDPGEGSPPNNASVVLHAQRGGHSALLMGDAEIAEQHRMVSTVRSEALAVDVLKVAHHGSAVQDPTFMALVAPEIALVPVGCRNRYGHPSAPLMRSFGRAGIPVARSDHDGDVAVVEQSGRWIAIARGPATTHGPSDQCG